MIPDPFDERREQMVHEQLAQRGIQDRRLLEAMRRLPRELFVPEEGRKEAYEDHPVAIGSGQTLSQPYMTALMTERLHLEPGQKVLEIGTGSGYQTALLAEMGGRVYSVEWISELAEHARQRLQRLSYRQVQLRRGDGSLGWPEEAPFDRILMTAGAPRLPESLVSQLGEGGRMILPLGEQWEQALTQVDRLAGQTHVTEICRCSFVPLRGKEGWAE